MNYEDQQRLAQIRADNAKWLAQMTDAEWWDTTFLLKVIDHLLTHKKTLV